MRLSNILLKFLPILNTYTVLKRLILLKYGTFSMSIVVTSQHMKRHVSMEKQQDVVTFSRDNVPKVDPTKVHLVSHIYMIQGFVFDPRV